MPSAPPAPSAIAGKVDTWDDCIKRGQRYFFGNRYPAHIDYTPRFFMFSAVTTAAALAGGAAGMQYFGNIPYTELKTTRFGLAHPKMGPMAAGCGLAGLAVAGGTAAYVSWLFAGLGQEKKLPTQ